MSTSRGNSEHELRRAAYHRWNMSLEHAAAQHRAAIIAADKRLQLDLAIAVGTKVGSGNGC